MIPVLGPSEVGSQSVSQSELESTNLSFQVPGTERLRLEDVEEQGLAVEVTEMEEELDLVVEVKEMEEELGLAVEVKEMEEELGLAVEETGAPAEPPAR